MDIGPQRDMEGGLLPAKRIDSEWIFKRNTKSFETDPVLNA